jgi:plastocyanin
VAGVWCHEDVPQRAPRPAQLPGASDRRGREQGPDPGEANLAPALAVDVRLRLLLAIGAAVFVGAASSASAQTLYGSIESGAIALRDGAGAPVNHTVAGTYTFEVTDRDTIHNFHLLGTAVDTPIDGTGTFTYPGVVLAEGFYTYVCDLHPEINGAFTVGAPPPPQTAPASIRRVEVVRSRGLRVVAIRFRVTRHATARIALARGFRRVASASRHLLPGRRTVRLRVRQSAPAGRYSLRVRLVDVGSGRIFRLARTVRLPRP